MVYVETTIRRKQGIVHHQLHQFNDLEDVHIGEDIPWGFLSGEPTEWITGKVLTEDEANDWYKANNDSWVKI